MFKRFRSVSMLLFLGGISVGVAHATPSMLKRMSYSKVMCVRVL